MRLTPALMEDLELTVEPLQAMISKVPLPGAPVLNDESMPALTPLETLPILPPVLDIPGETHGQMPDPLPEDESQPESPDALGLRDKMSAAESIAMVLNTEYNEFR